MSFPQARSLAPAAGKSALVWGELQALLDLLPEAAMVVDLRTQTVVSANSKAIELTAFTRSELVGMRLEQLFPETRPAHWSKLLAQASPFETGLGRHLGPLLPSRVNAHPLGNRSERMLVTVEPVALYEQRLAEENYRQRWWQAACYLAFSLSQADLDAALSQALQAGHLLTGASLLAIYQADGEKTCLHRTASLGACQAFPETLDPADWFALQQPMIWLPGKRAVASLHRAARLANLPYLATTTLGHANASIGLLAISDPQTLPPAYMLEALSLLATTLTAIIQTQAQVNNLTRRSDEQRCLLAYADAVKDAVGEAVISVADDLSVLEMNPAAEQMLGYATSEVNGRPLESVLVGIEALLSALTEARRHTVLQSLGNVTLYRRNGQAFLARLRLQPMPDDLRGALILFIEDLSPQEALRSRSEQLEQRALLGELSAVFAHEVRNPINNISTGLQLLALNLPLDSSYQDTLARLQQDCDRLEHLMKSVLTASRPVEYHMQPVNVQQLITRLLDRWHARLLRANVREKFDLEPGTPDILGDERALEQVFSNLISNAIEAMNQTGGTLTIKGAPVRVGEVNQVEVSVSDSGPGIPDEVRERLFEPFFTMSKTGTGLGLPIAKQIITAHKGSIQVVSVPGGTSFRVCLPAVARLEEA